MKVTEFTVTHAFDTYKNGSKSQQFVSMRCTVDTDIDHFPLIQLKAKLAVGKACIYNALATGDMNVEEANEHILMLKTNIDEIEKTLSSKSDVK